MKLSGKFKIFCMAYVYFMLIILSDAIYRWSGIYFYMTFWEFIPSLAVMITIFTILAVITAGILKLLEIIVNPLLKRTRILTIDIKVLYAWFFLVVVSILIVKVGQQWVDSFTSIPHWNVIRLIIFITIIIGASALAYKMREGLIESIRDRLTPVFWIFAVISVGSVLFVVLHTIQKTWQDSPYPVKLTKTNTSTPNIILVTMDALTARDMSLYGYERKTTPFLEDFVKESHLFTRFYSNSNFTTPSVVSLLTSKYPWHHQIYHLLDSIPDDKRSENIARVLRENGYTTMAFVVNPAADPFRLNIARDFDIAIPSYELVNPQKLSTCIELMARGILKNRFGIALPWLGYYIKTVFPGGDTSVSEVPIRLAFDSFFSHVSTVRKPFFAWIHLNPPHDPYLPPEHYKNTFARKDEVSNEKAQMNDSPYPLSKQGYIDSLRKRYDEFILYCDAELKYFVKQLKEIGLYDKSLLILSSDHGENFEKGYYGHRGPFLYEPLVHIPMIIHEPGQIEGTRIKALGEQIDLAPTLLDYLGFPKPDWMEGKSLSPALRNGTFLMEPKYSMWFEKNRSLNHPITTGTVAIFDDEYKLIYYIQKGQSELYNLRQDPKENDNLIDKQPLVAKRLESIILGKIRDINTTRKSQ